MDLADDTFYVNGSVERVSLSALDGVLGRTGDVLASVSDPDSLATMPDVAEVLRRKGHVVLIRLDADVDDLAFARWLHGQPGVSWAIPNLIADLRLDVLPSDPFVADMWHIENTLQHGGVLGVDINATAAWAHASGAGQTIAVLDSGVQLDHPDLNVRSGIDLIDGDRESWPSPDDSGPHGTACAGVAAGLGNNGFGVAGVAWEAEVLAVHLIGGYTSLDDLYVGFSDSVDEGATVLSNSWGWSYGCPVIPDYSLFDDMYAYAEEQGRGGLGAAVVFAAGNSACDIDNDAMLADERAVVVAAVEPWDVRAGYSSFGDAVDIAAPTGLLTTDMTPGGYGSYDGDDAFADYFNGTSAATPVVAGVMALMFSANPRLTAADAREYLCLTATKNDLIGGLWSVDGRSPYYGCGRVDAGAAVAAVANTEPLAPVPLRVVETTPKGRAVIAWEPAVDPDGDVLTHEVSWWWEASDKNKLQTTDGWVDLDDYLEVGDVVTWKVRAIDPWGPGPWSAETTLTVVKPEHPPPAPAGGCDEGGAAIGLLALPLGWRRRATGAARPSSTGRPNAPGGSGPLR